MAGICVSAAVLLLGLVSTAVITALTALGGHTRDSMSNVANTLGNAY
jgi:Flp pilus assembly pilin Flp